MRRCSGQRGRSKPGEMSGGQGKTGIRPLDSATWGPLVILGGVVSMQKGRGRGDAAWPGLDHCAWRSEQFWKVSSWRRGFKEGRSRKEMELRDFYFLSWQKSDPHLKADRKKSLRGWSQAEFSQNLKLLKFFTQCVLLSCSILNKLNSKLLITLLLLWSCYPNEIANSCKAGFKLISPLLMGSPQFSVLHRENSQQMLFLAHPFVYSFFL